MALKYKRMVRHKPRPRPVTKPFSRNSYTVVSVEKNGSYVSQSKLNGRKTRYLKSGRKSKNQKNL